MWEPVGPLPAGVYWRRRLVALCATLGLLVVAAWSAAAWLASAGPPAVPAAVLAAVNQTAPPTTAPATPAPPVDPAVVVVPSAAPAVGPHQASGRRSGPPAGTTGPAAVPAGRAPAPADPTEQLLPDDSAPRTGPPPTPIPVPATGPVPCTDAMLGVGAGIDQPSHRVGDHPVLRLVVTNVSDQPCVRDLDAARQEIVVWGPDGSRLWSSNDCSTARGVDLRTLVPAQPVVFAITWAGRTTVPGCTGVRTTVPAGSYNLLTRVDGVISPAAPFTRTP
jgi:hypothetical protein